MKSVRSILTCPLFLLLFLAACAPSTPSALRSDSAQDAPTPTPQPTATALPTATLIPTATATATATATPLPTATATATATATSTPLPPAEIINGKLILRNPDGKTETLDVPAGAVLASPDGYSIKVEGKIFDRSVVKTAKQGEVKVWTEKGNPENLILAETPHFLTFAEMPMLAAGTKLTPENFDPNVRNNMNIYINGLLFERARAGEATILSLVLPGIDDLSLITDGKGALYLRTNLVNTKGVKTAGNDLIFPMVLVPTFTKGIAPLIEVQNGSSLNFDINGVQKMISNADYLTKGWAQYYFVDEGGYLSVAIRFGQFSSRNSQRNFESWRDLQ